ncbi:MAG TPA: hypothetical protein VF037_07940 [Gemmatimonadales bacterium]
MLAAAFACGSEEPEDGRCTEDLAFTITPGINPTFAWTPNCTIAQLRVIRNSTDEEVWSFVASSNSVSPAVTYGQVPIGADETHENEVLLFGQEYTVRVAVLDPDEGLLLVAGDATFVPN